MMDEKGGMSCQSQLHGRARPSPATRLTPVASPSSHAEVYEQLRARYGLRTRLPVYSRRVERARSVVAEALAVGPTAIMVSGGKDSVALLHLARQINPEIPAFFVNDGAQLPWTLEVIDRLRQMGHAIMTLDTVISLPDMYRKVGMLGYDGPDRLDGEWHWTTDDFRRVLIDEPSERVRDMGYPVHLLGLRADESWARMVNRRAHGVIYGRKNGVTIACPLADWSGEDVFAFIVSHDLPLSPIYLQPDDPERERRRTAAVLIDEAARMGEWRRIRELLPDYWAELASEFPSIRRRS